MFSFPLLVLFLKPQYLQGSASSGFFSICCVKKPFMYFNYFNYRRLAKHTDRDGSYGRGHPWQAWPSSSGPQFMNRRATFG